jgi:hypothetical protein
MAMTINNLCAFDAAIRAACPDIDGVAADGYIFFQPSATDAQKTAAADAAAAYVDPEPVAVPDLAGLIQALVDKGVLSAADVTAISTMPPVLTPPVKLPPS